MNRPALTVLNLLIAVGLTLLLVGLLLPAVVNTRRAADRIRSQNNLKQIALACHNYHDALGRFPFGVDAQGYAVHAHLLPYLEQQAIFDKIDFKKPANEAPGRDVLLKIYVSPLDPLPRVRNETGPTNYLFNAGSQSSLAKNDGVFFKDSQKKIIDIHDGTSNTIMVSETLKGDNLKGEKATVERRHVRWSAKDLKDLTSDSGVKDFQDGKNLAGDRGSVWMEGRFLQTLYTATRGINDAKPDVDGSGEDGLSALRSLDGQAINVAFCDGSVRGLSPKLALKTFTALHTIAGGETVNLNE